MSIQYTMLGFEPTTSPPITTRTGLLPNFKVVNKCIFACSAIEVQIRHEMKKISGPKVVLEKF